MVAAVTVAVFAPALGGGFVWEDRFNIVENPNVRGLGAAQLRWMLTAIWDSHQGRCCLWIPVTWASFGVDHVLWGRNPAGYHLTSLVLHAANAALFYHLATLLLARAHPGAAPGRLRLGAAAAALFFAVHPLRAESVAWITERRDVLSGVFVLLTVWTYLQAAGHAGGRRRRWLAVSVIAYVVALSSKPTVMTLPGVLLVLDAYPLGRLAGAWRARLLEKLLYLVPALAVAVLNLHALAIGSSLTPLATHPLGSRLAMAAWGLARYLWTTVLPVDLSPLYETPARIDPGSLPYLASMIGVIAVTLVTLALWRRWPAGLAVWTAYVVFVAPVSGIAHTGLPQGADRYTYLPSLGVALLVGGGIIAVLRASDARRLPARSGALAVAGVAAWLVTLGGLAHAQTYVWRDEGMLWRWAVTVDPRCGACHGNLGEALRGQGQLEPAIAHLRTALALRPDQRRAQVGLGFALLQAGRLAEAADVLVDAARTFPGDVEVRRFAGLALAHTGRPADAVPHFQAATALAPARADLQANLAVAFAILGRTADARRHAEQALALAPADRDARRVLDRLDGSPR